MPPKNEFKCKFLKFSSKNLHESLTFTPEWMHSYKLSGDLLENKCSEKRCKIESLFSKVSVPL